MRGQRREAKWFIFHTFSQISYTTVYNLNCMEIHEIPMIERTSLQARLQSIYELSPREGRGTSKNDT